MSQLYKKLKNSILIFVLVLLGWPLPAFGQAQIDASAPVDILAAIRVIPMSIDFLRPFVNEIATFSEPGFREKLLTPLEDIEVLKDVPNGFVRLARHWNRKREDPKCLEFALFRGDGGRWVVVGSYFLNHPDGYWSCVEAWLWENGFWREATKEIMPSFDLRTFYPAKKPPAKMFQAILVQYQLPRQGTDILAIPHECDLTDPDEHIRRGMDKWNRLHPKNTSSQNLTGYSNAYRQAVKKAPYQPLKLSFNRQTCRFTVR